ncbi:DUF3592 domain-containing protein [Mucilaginibacter sp. OK283]|jgi:hypothetical protein|uniref:DUF3592 domain-containing protein n=1 Tax=Mucilaginibacter sp. OK283 TaxID=1881049 RepID=UPI0008AF1CA1|nr:DUF3592 domain-containing protein [Mucilaginibacter sp. OK283]SEP41836.1 Protein of unknown function [Mucilaginibacter sp. OK283]
MNATINELILLAGGTFLTVLGIGKIIEVRKLYKTGTRAIGTVVALEEIAERPSRGDTPMIMYYPLIKYMASDNQWMTVRYDVGTNPASYREGDRVKIIYDGADYKRVIIDNSFSRLIGFGIMILGICLIIGVAVYYILNQYQPT